MNAEERELKKITSEKITSNILRNRNQKIEFKPGYDGVYGVPLFNGKEGIENKISKSKASQKGLDEFW